MERIRKLADIYVIVSKCLPTLKEDMISGLIDILDINTINTPLNGMDSSEFLTKKTISSDQNKKSPCVSSSLQLSNKITGKIVNRTFYSNC